MTPATATTASEPAPRISRETLGYLFGFLGVLTFSFTFPFTRIAVRELDPTFVGLGRALIAATLSGGLLFLTRQPLPTQRQFTRLAVVALGVVVGFPLFSAWASRFVNASHSAIVNALLPLATAVLGAIVSGDRPSRRFWIAAMIGSATVIAFILLTSGQAIETGDLAMLGAVALASIGYVSGGRMSAQIGSWQTICWANVVAAPFLIVPVLLTMPAQANAISFNAWLAFGYLGVFSMFLGFFAWYRGLAIGGITRVSQVQLIQTFLTITWSWLILSEIITPLMLAAACIVVMCIVIARRAPIRKAAAR
jgi:drug/metabolite transporter (DMT)-like permease